MLALAYAVNQQNAPEEPSYATQQGLVMLQDAEQQLKSQHADKKEARAQKQRLLEAAWEDD